MKPSMIVLMLFGGLLLTGCTQVKYAKVEETQYKNDKLIYKNNYKAVVISTLIEHGDIITNKNGDLYISSILSDDGTVETHTKNLYSGTDVKWITLADGDSYPVTYSLHGFYKKYNTTQIVKVLEIGRTYKIGNYLL